MKIRFERIIVSILKLVECVFVIKVDHSRLQVEALSGVNAYSSKRRIFIRYISNIHFSTSYSLNSTCKYVSFYLI